MRWMNCLHPSDKLQQRMRWTNSIFNTASTATCRGYCLLNGKNPFLPESGTQEQRLGMDWSLFFVQSGIVTVTLWCFWPSGKGALSCEMPRPVTEPFCQSLRKLGFNPGRVPLRELEIQISFKMEVSAGYFWDLWMKNAALVFPYVANFGYVPRSEMSHCMLALYKCWNFPVHSASVHYSWKEVALKHFGAESKLNLIARIYQKQDCLYFLTHYAGN